MHYHIMRTSIRNGICLVFALAALSACKKDFLDLEPTELPTADQIKEAGKWNPDVPEGFVNGILSTFFKSMQSTRGNHADFAQKAFDISSDLMSGDMEMSQTNYAWFQSPARLVSYQKDDIMNYSVWRISYRTVALSNSFFQSAGGDETIPSGSVQKQTIFSWGQVKTLRALAYLNLAHFYGGAYSDATKSKLTVPIYKASDDASKPKGLSTLEQVYDQIVKDLTQGIEAMESSGLKRSDKQYVDQTVARGALARAYMDIGNWEEAYNVANKVITEKASIYKLIPASELTTNGFNNYKTPEFIWAIDITKDNTGGLASFWGHMDVYTYSYALVGAHKAINQYLADEIPDTDLRKGWFHASLGVPVGKFFSVMGKTHGLGYDRTWLSDIVFMRMAEIYLIASEAAARKGDDPTAKTLLLKLLKERTEAAKYSEVENEINGLNHDDLIKKLLYNWRVEMWGEGFSLVVMRRFKNEVKRSPRNSFLQGATIKWDDARLIYEIPQQESTNNQLIK